MPAAQAWTRLKANSEIPALGCIDRMLDFVARHPAAIAKPAQGFVPNIGAA